MLARSVLAAVALLLPLFSVWIWLSLSSDTWPYVLSIICGISALALLGALGGHRMRVFVSADGLKTRGLLGRVIRITPAEIARIVLVDIYQTGTLDALPHLYLLNSAGDVLLHLRGQFWPLSGMETLIDTLGIAAERPPEPLTATELARLRPHLVHHCLRRAARLGF
jgi:hypothetical protein